MPTNFLGEMVRLIDLDRLYVKMELTSAHILDHFKNVSMSSFVTEEAGLPSSSAFASK